MYANDRVVRLAIQLIAGVLLTGKYAEEDNFGTMCCVVREKCAAHLDLLRMLCGVLLSFLWMKSNYLVA